MLIKFKHFAKMAGGLVGILPKKKKLTIYIGLSEIIRQYI